MGKSENSSEKINTFTILVKEEILIKTQNLFKKKVRIKMKSKVT